MSATDGGLTQLRAWLAQRNPPPNERLPPERELCDVLGVSRGELRKALAILETNGELWRHVGKGTFVGVRPVEELSSITAIAERSNPIEVMKARLMIEPMLASEAAVNATGSDLEEMNRCLRAQREATTWRQYENADNRLHRIIAEAAGNTVLTALFDQLNAVRRAVVWGRLRVKSNHPPHNHHSFSEHGEIVSAIVERDQERAFETMRQHLLAVRKNLMQARPEEG